METGGEGEWNVCVPLFKVPTSNSLKCAEDHPGPGPMLGRHLTQCLDRHTDDNFSRVGGAVEVGGGQKGL